MIVDGMESKEIFKWCLQDWEGFIDPKGEPMKLTDSVKEKIFESNLMGLAAVS